MRSPSALVAVVLVGIVFLSSSFLGSPAYVPAFGHLAILIHDVSPAYLPQLEEITSLIDEYGLQNETYLFVIPDHGGRMPIWRYGQFMEFLRGLDEEGYHIELHGYTHIGDEFDCNASTAERKLELGMEALSRLNVTPEYFIAPRYSLSKPALGVLLVNNLTVIGKGTIYFPNGTVERICNREYTWYIPGTLVWPHLLEAEGIYSNSRITFFLSVHPKAVNNGAGMMFLREFLRFVDGARGSEDP